MNKNNNRSVFILVIFACALLIKCNRINSFESKESDHQPKYLEKVSYLHVKIDDKFWGPKIELSRINGLRSVFESGKSSLNNFRIAAGESNGEHNQMMASDSDIYKIIQGVAYALHHSADKELEAFTDKLIDSIVGAQEEDGYLFTPYIVSNSDKRWTNLNKDHELYCAGHLFEAAVAYYEVTGKRKLLDAAIKLADHIDAIFGRGKRIDIPGHQEIELALIKLYKTTGDEKYLKLSTFFINERGNPKRVDTIPPAHDPNAGTPNRWRHPSYRQDHLPVEKQYHATGHGVRAMYMYSAMADLEMEVKSGQYIPALDSLWKDIVTKKMYVTAGIGTHEFHDEGFGTPYKLPNHSAYSETCSGIGFTHWNRRMGLLYGQSKYADMVEHLLYNAAISSVSLEGNKFFYRNLLASSGNYRRRPWFNPACCPSNMVRFLPEIGGTIYAKDDKAIYINQFIGNEANIQLKESLVHLKMQANFPWEGNVNIMVVPANKASFKLYVRIPGWAEGDFIPGSDLYTIEEDTKESGLHTIIKLNNEPIDQPVIRNGYLVLEKEWLPGDQVTLEFPIKSRAVFGHPAIEATAGKVAVMRGPVVYCLEETDNPSYFENSETYSVHYNSLKGEFDNRLLGGIVKIKSTASNAAGKNTALTYVPYYSWANRDEGKMTVWAPN
jgi:hypothetical protein